MFDMVLNIPRVLNMLLVLNMPGLSIHQGSKNVSVSECPRVPRIPVLPRVFNMPR